MSEYIKIDVEIMGYEEERHGYKAVDLANGREIIVDPFVGLAWEISELEENKEGKYTFLGHWYDEELGVFLPSKEIK